MMKKEGRAETVYLGSETRTAVHTMAEEKKQKVNQIIKEAVEEAVKKWIKEKGKGSR